MQATALAEQHGGHRISHREFIELEPANLASIPRYIDIAQDDFDRVVAAKARRGGRYNSDIVSIIRQSAVFSELSADGYQLLVKKGAVSSVVFSDSGPAAVTVNQLANAVQAGQGKKPKGKLPGGKWMHAFADFRPAVRKVFLLKTDKPLEPGEMPPEASPAEVLPVSPPSSPEVRLVSASRRGKISSRLPDGTGLNNPETALMLIWSFIHALGRPVSRAEIHANSGPLGVFIKKGNDHYLATTLTKRKKWLVKPSGPNVSQYDMSEEGLRHARGLSGSHAPVDVQLIG